MLTCSFILFCFLLLRQLLPYKLTVRKMLDTATRLRLHRGEFGPICLTTQVANRPCTAETFGSATGILIRNYVSKHPRMLEVAAQNTPWKGRQGLDVWSASAVSQLCHPLFWLTSIWNKKLFARDASGTLLYCINLKMFQSTSILLRMWRKAYSSLVSSFDRPASRNSFLFVAY